MYFNNIDNMFNNRTMLIENVLEEKYEKLFIKFKFIKTNA
jgi:hypothetical protein